MPTFEPALSFRKGRDRKFLFYGQCLVWVVYIELLAMMRAYELGDGDFTYGLCVFLGIFSIWSLWSWKRVTGYYCDLYSLVLLTLVLFSGGQAILEIFELNPHGILNGIHPESVTKDCVLLVVNCLMAFHSGALLHAFTLRNRKPAEIAAMEETAKPSRGLGTIMIMISLAPASYVLYQDWIVAQAYGYMALYQQSNVPTGVDNWYAILATFLVPGALLLLAGSQGRYIGVLIPWILIAVPSVAYLLIGHRNVGLQALAALLWLHSAAIKPISRKFVILGVVIGLFVVPALASLRDDPAYSKNKLEFLLNAFEKIESPLVSNLTEMGGTLSTIVYTVELVPQVRPYDWGLGYLTALTTVIPNLFWDIHPAQKRGAPTEWLINQVDPYVARFGGGIGFSMIAEAYLNFTWYGAPFFMLFLGFTVGSFVLWVLERPDSLRLATEASLISFVLFFARADSHMIMRPLFWMCLIPYLIVSYLGRPTSLRVRATSPLLRQSRKRLEEVH